MQDSVTARKRDVLGPVTSTVIAASAFVATAAYLDAQWPRVPALGAPIGLWAVVAAAGGVAYMRSRGAPTGARATQHFPAISEHLSRLTPMAYTFIKRVALAAGFTDKSIERIEDAWVRRMDRARADSPLLIGLDVAPALAGAIMRAPTAVPVRWIDLSAPGGEHLPLDAAVTARSGLMQITTRETDDREASWYDWSRARPLSYSSVFPLRVDPSRITLGEPETAAEAPQAVAALAIAAAALSRGPSRLTLPDRLSGRNAVSPQVIDAAMAQLAEVALDGACPVTLRASALRGASAYLSTAEGTDAGLRRRVSLAAVEVLPTEPEPILRLAAAFFAALEDDAGYEACLSADTLIRGLKLEPIQNHLAFLQSEVELGLPTPATLGRVAAGVTLVCACAPAGNAGYFRDDLLDDLRYSGWLVGRDQDRAVLVDLFRRLGHEAPLKAAA